MRSIVVTPLKSFEISVEAENISPDRFAPLTLDGIRGLEIWQGNRKRTLRDLFRVEGDDSQASPEDLKITLQGDFSRVKRIAEGMTAGVVEVQGNAGMHAGNSMSGGLLSIKGNADDWLGREMRGGKVIVSGSAGNYIGAGYRGEKCGMRGGEIEMVGSLGAYLGGIYVEEAFAWPEMKATSPVLQTREARSISRRCPSSRRRDDQRNYNCKGQGQCSARLPKDRDHDSRWRRLSKVCRRPGGEWKGRTLHLGRVILINRDGNMRDQHNYFEVL